MLSLVIWPVTKFGNLDLRLRNKLRTAMLSGLDVYAYTLKFVSITRKPSSWASAETIALSELEDDTSEVADEVSVVASRVG